MAGTLSGTVAIVTGASSGIGRAIAERYEREGASVVLAGIDVSGLEETATRIDGQTLVVECNVRDEEMVRATVKETKEVFGRIDTVVSNAGITARNAIVDAPDEDIERVIDVNLKGTMRVARESLPELIRTTGSFIATSSQLGQVGISDAGAYCASKVGIDGLIRQLAIEHATDGVRINAIAPGVIYTPIADDLRAKNPNWAEEKLERIPMGRIGAPEDVAGPAVFLASEDARYVTGHVLTVDGGYTAE